MTLNQLLKRWSPITLYLTETTRGRKGYRLDYGHGSYSGATVEECIYRFLEKHDPKRKIEQGQAVANDDIIP